MNLSIIIPTYNEEKYLAKTLDSISSQNYNIGKEVIVSDSNSSDRTTSLALKKGAVVVNGPKKGPSLGRNLGAKHAKNDYLLFINSDVVLEPNLFKVLEENIDEKHVAYIVKLAPDKKNFVNNLFFGVYNQLNPFLVKNLDSLAIYPGEFICIRKDVFNKIKGFNNNYHLSEDRDLLTRAKKYGKIKFLNDTHAEISLRRIDNWGWTKFLTFHLKSHLHYTFNKRPLNDIYEEIR